MKFYTSQQYSRDAYIRKSVQQCFPLYTGNWSIGEVIAQGDETNKWNLKPFIESIISAVIPLPTTYLKPKERLATHEYHGALNFSFFVKYVNHLCF